MTLPPVAYARPASVAEAVTLLGAPGARVLAGGQSLVPALEARATTAGRLVDLARVPGLDTIALDGDRLVLGAMVRQRAAEHDPLVARHAPLLAAALREVGHPSTRNRGTVVGSLCHADPAGEVPAVAVALDGVAHVAGPGGSRTVPVTALLTGPGTLALAPGELVTALSLTAQPPGAGSAWLETAPRRYDLPVVGAAAVVAADGTALRLVLAGVGPVPADRSAAVRAAADGAEPAPGHRNRAIGDAAVAGLAPAGDQRASAALRLHLARTLAVRALEAARG